MTPERRQQVELLYRAALQKPTGERIGFVATQSTDDPELRFAVEALLSHGGETQLREPPPPDRDRSIAPGTTLGSYRIEETIGSGGMGVVYRAVDPRLNREVAIKFLSEAMLDASARRRFQREAQMASALNHPHILTVHDIGEHDGRQYLVTEIVDGGTLEDWQRGSERRGWREIVELLIGVADGLAVAHAANILHRDIKPGNILVSRNGYAKLADFGLAKSADATAPGREGQSVTRAGAVIGTLAYMSPEQMTGHAVDARSDVFAFGVVLYEQLARRRPFEAASDLDLMNAVVRATPEPLPDRVPHALRAIVDKALQKDPAERYQSMRELVADLRRLTRETTVPEALRGLARRRKWPLRAAGLVAAMAVAVAAYWLWQRDAQARWARTVAVPEVARLVDAGDIPAAFALAENAGRFARDDAQLQRLAPMFKATYSVNSTPADAAVFVRGYGAADEDWQQLGRTPLVDLSVPRRALRWRIEKQGFEPAEFASGALDDNRGLGTINAELRPAGAEGGDMVSVPGRRVAPQVGGVSLPPVALDAYAIARYEVTNAQWKEFVDAGAYERRDYWEGLEFNRDGAPLSWEEAMRAFVDTTGRPGPSSWELGDFPSGQDRYPVTGISWYEAMAYARFRGQALPTAYHWANAALPASEAASGFAASVVPLSNFNGRGPADVGTYQGLGPFGTYDMYGNAAEWSFNHDDDGAWTFGGAWQDASYNFSIPARVRPMDRSRPIGLRLMQAPQKELPAAALGDLAMLRAPAQQPGESRQPAGEVVYAAYVEQFAYRPGELEATEPTTVATSDAWIRQRVTIDAGYGGERLDVNVFLPVRAQPPYQALVYFPSFDVFVAPRSSADLQPGGDALPLDFVVKSGRVLVWPIYQGTFERFRAPFDSNDDVREQREWVERRWDLGRTLDYLATRGDIDAQRIGYLGLSFGSQFSLPLLAVEPRFRTAVLVAGGLTPALTPASIDPVHYVPHIRIPVLMINGRFDYLFPVEEAQKPLFALLGSPAADKRHVLVDSGHVVPRSLVLRESLGWLDQYLGPAP